MPPRKKKAGGKAAEKAKDAGDEEGAADAVSELDRHYYMTQIEVNIM